MTPAWLGDTSPAHLKRRSRQETRGKPMPAVYHGWWVVAGLFLILTVSSGFGFYNHSVYLNALSADGAFSVANVSVAISFYFLSGGVAGIGVARLIDLVEVRRIMIVGAAIAGIALALLGQARELWQLHGLFMLFGIGNTGVSIVIATTLVTRWFPGRNRSIALSLASTGLSVGGMVFTPMTALLLERMAFDLVALGLGVAFFLLTAPVALLVARLPDAGAEDTTATHEAGPWRLRAALGTRFFVLLTLAYILCFLAQVGGIAHLYNYAEADHGYAIASQAVQVLAIMGVMGRFLGGWLVTRISIRAFALTCSVLQAAGLAGLALADAPWEVLLAAAAFGASVGNLLMLQPLWLAEAFGVKSYPRIFSVANACALVGVASGPLLLGQAYAVVGYSVAYLAAAVTALAAFGCMAAAGHKPAPQAASAGSHPEI